MRGMLEIIGICWLLMGIVFYDKYAGNNKYAGYLWASCLMIGTLAKIGMLLLAYKSYAG
jgi:hypothetical protein